jgi:hypothetical protein
MRKTNFKIILLPIIFIFLFSDSFCFFDTIGNLFTDIIEPKDFANNKKFAEDEKNAKNKNSTNTEINLGLEFYNIFLKMMVDRNFQIKTTINTINNFIESNTQEQVIKEEDLKYNRIKEKINPKENMGNKKSSFLIRRKKSEDSIFEKIIISDVMLIYSLAEIFLSLSIAFILIPTIVIFRKWIKSFRRKVIKEIKMDYSEFKNEFSNNPIEEKDCSICLDKIIMTSINKINSDSNKEEESIIMSYLDCGHMFHSLCIKEWINRSKETCPFCRKEIDTIKFIKM